MTIPINKINLVSNKEAANLLNFTQDQRKAYEDIISFISSPYNANDYKRALVGPAGTGKTYLVKALIKNSGLSYSRIGLAAPTHKACRVLNESIDIPNININTLQSDLGLKLNFDVDKFDINNPPFDPKGKIKINTYSLYIVDEASMINRNLAMFLEKVCKTHSCKLLYIGDASQLPPVNERYSAALKGVKTSTLKQIVRQGEDNPVSHLLELLRYDIEHKTFKFIEYIVNNRSKFNEDNTKGYAVCTPTEFQDVVFKNFSDEELTNNVDFCKIVAYTNNTVSSWNKFVRNAIIKDAQASVITKNDLIISYVTLVDTFNSPIIKNSEEYILKDVVNYIHPTYQLKGFMVKFTAIHGGTNTAPLFVVNHKDMFTVEQYLRISRDLIQAAKSAPLRVRPQKWREYFIFKEQCLLLADILRYDGTIEFPRSLDYGFALTSHKSQGSTFDTVLVDVNDVVFDRYGRPYANAEEINRRLYVACSRCRNKLYLQYGK